MKKAFFTILFLFLIGCGSAQEIPSIDSGSAIIFQSPKGFIGMVEKIDGKSVCGFMTCPTMNKISAGWHKIKIYCNFGNVFAHSIIDMEFKAGHYYELKCNTNYSTAKAALLDRGMHVDLTKEQRECNVLRFCNTDL